MTITYALLAALCHALNVTAQHLGSISSSKKSAGLRFVVSLLRNPRWLAGWGALAGGFVFQALALHEGQMSVVQPLLITEIVFALALRRVWLRQSIRGITWWAAAGTCASLSVFPAASEPQGGTHYPDSHAWATGAWGAVGAGCRVHARQHRPPDGTDGIVRGRHVGAGRHAGQDHDRHLFIVNPIVSIALSVWIFQEHFTADPAQLALGSAAFAAMCVSGAVLTRTAPATMSSADAPGSPAPSAASGPAELAITPPSRPRSPWRWTVASVRLSQQPLISPAARCPGATGHRT